MTGIQRLEGFERKLREEHGAPGERIFTLSGLTGVGTSTLSQFLARRFDLDLVSAGEFFRDQARKRNLSVEEFVVRKEEIEKEEGVDFDLEWEKKVLELAFRRDQILFEGRLSGVLLYNIAEVRVLVTCSEKVAAERMAEREKVSQGRALRELKNRNEELIKTSREKYQVDPRNEEYYNLIIDNSGPLKRTKQNLLRKIEERGEG